MISEVLQKFTQFTPILKFDSMVEFECKDITYAYNFMNRLNKLAGSFGQSSMHVTKGSCIIKIEFIKMYERDIVSFLEHIYSFN